MAGGRTILIPLGYTTSKLLAYTLQLLGITSCGTDTCSSLGLIHAVRMVKLRPSRLEWARLSSLTNNREYGPTAQLLNLRFSRITLEILGSLARVLPAFEDLQNQISPVLRTMTWYGVTISLVMYGIVDLDRREISGWPLIQVVSSPNYCVAWMYFPDCNSCIFDAASRERPETANSDEPLLQI